MQEKQSYISCSLPSSRAHFFVDIYDFFHKRFLSQSIAVFFSFRLLFIPTDLYTVKIYYSQRWLSKLKKKDESLLNRGCRLHRFKYIELNHLFRVIPTNCLIVNNAFFHLLERRLIVKIL